MPCAALSTGINLESIPPWCSQVHQAWHPCTGPNYPVNIMNKTLQTVRKHNETYFEVELVDITNPALSEILGEYAAEFPVPPSPPVLYAGVGSISS